MDQERLPGREVAIGRLLEGSGKQGSLGYRVLEWSQVRGAQLGLSWRN
jgi:hypothetical protein